jgi:hypothetical protein
MLLSGTQQFVAQSLGFVHSCVQLCTFSIVAHSVPGQQRVLVSAQAWPAATQFAHSTAGAQTLPRMLPYSRQQLVAQPALS